MHGLSPTIRQLLHQTQTLPDHDAIVRLQDEWDQPAAPLSPWDQLVLLQELFRLAITTHTTHLVDRFVPAAQTCIEQHSLPASPLLAYFLCTFGTYLELVHRSREAEALYYRALNTAPGTPDDCLIAPNVLTPRWLALISLARQLVARGQYTTASTYLTTTISEIQGYYPTPIEELIDLQCELAQTHQRLGALDKSLRSLTHAFDTALAIYGDPHLRVADIAERVGQAYLHHRLPTHAQLFFQRALQIYRYLEHGPRLIRCLTNLAAVSHILEQYPHAYQYNQEALTLLPHHAVDPTTHMGVVWNTALTCAFLQRFPEALRHCATVATLLTADPCSNQERRDAYLAQLHDLVALCQAGQAPEPPSPPSNSVPSS